MSDLPCVLQGPEVPGATRLGLIALRRSFASEVAMFVLVSYDIADDRQRNKVATLLEARGTRVQYSVFECNLTEVQLVGLKKKLAKFVKEDDSIRFYRLCKECVERVEIIGTGEVTVERMYYIV
jgi:CRISPR-associated protein Cas2